VDALAAEGPRIRRVCVFCGATDGNRPEYTQAGRELGALLAKNGLELVYGGGGFGVMGAVAEAVRGGGASVIGVMPHSILKFENPPSSIRLYLTKTMHERKTIMYDKADAFIALPGGLGTFDELFEIATWAKLGLHSKPIIVLNIKGYFNHLFALLEYSVVEGFVQAPQMAKIHLVSEVTDVHELLGLPQP
jgi:uncharacterized protein (TIGR00730 family)